MEIFHEKHKKLAQIVSWQSTKAKKAKQGQMKEAKIELEKLLAAAEKSGLDFTP